MNGSVRLMKIILSIAVFSFFHAPFLEASPSAPAAGKDIVEGNNAFAVKLYRELGAKEGNLLFSPYSVSSALGMTYAGARGNTAEEMARALLFPKDQARLHPAFRALGRELALSAGKGGQRLDIANALILTGGEVSTAFKAIVKKDYDAEIFDGGLDSVNNWVKQKTEGKIDKILEELSPDSVCVLLNAVYFKGVWESRFDRLRTFGAPFSVSAGRKVTVSLMRQKNEFKVMGERDFKAISLPYQGDTLSMVVVLPNSVDGLSALEKQLTAGNLKSWLGKLDREEPRAIEIFLPKFRLAAGYDLLAPLRAMGVNDAFRPKEADFSGMGWRKGRLWIGQIKHKAFVDVNEEGAEAAAATSVEMITKIMLEEPVFKADHPFLFMIRDNRSGSILFMGRVADPTGGRTSGA